MFPVLRQKQHHGSTEARARHDRACPVSRRLAPQGGKPVHVTFNGGRLTSDAGVLVLAEVERCSGLPSAWPAASPTRGSQTGCTIAWPR